MHDELDAKVGPSIGELAPLFESSVGNSSISLKDFRGKWVILISHASDIAPVFKTRTINYILCKRRTKVIALQDGHIDSVERGGNVLKKFILRHNFNVIADPDFSIACRYGLSGDAGDRKGIFLIDPRGILRIKIYLPLETERNLYEMLKLVDALQKPEQERLKRSSAKRWSERIGISIPLAVNEKPQS